MTWDHTDPTFLGPTLNFFGTSENFSSISRLFFFNDYHAFSYINNFQKNSYLPSLKILRRFRKQDIYFFWPYYSTFKGNTEETEKLNLRI